MSDATTALAVDRQCPYCGFVGTDDDFYHGYRQCKECRRKANREYNRAYNRDPQKRELRRRKRLAARYGLTLAEFNGMLEAQGEGCGACGHVPGPHEKRLHVDHNHETGQVRGLLCFTCNVALGNVGDSRERLLALVTYLDCHG